MRSDDDRTRVDHSVGHPAGRRSGFFLAEQFVNRVRYCCFGRVRMVPELSRPTEKENQ